PKAGSESFPVASARTAALESIHDQTNFVVSTAYTSIVSRIAPEIIRGFRLFSTVPANSAKSGSGDFRRPSSCIACTAARTPSTGVAISRTVLKLYLASVRSDLSTQTQYTARAAAQASAA